MRPDGEIEGASNVRHRGQQMLRPDRDTGGI